MNTATIITLVLLGDMVCWLVAIAIDPPSNKWTALWGLIPLSGYFLLIKKLIK
jgi:hypothetical protein